MKMLSPHSYLNWQEGGGEGEMGLSSCYSLCVCAWVAQINLCLRALSGIQTLRPHGKNWTVRRGRRVRTPQV